MQRRTLNHLIGASLIASTVGARAQSWPARPVKLAVAHPPGSGVDAIARLLGDYFAKAWNTGVVVENKPGGQNVIGAQYVARSPADGYTLYLATAAALVTNVYLFKDLPYDPRKDFAPIGFVGMSPFGIMVPANSRFSSLQDFVQKAKDAPGAVSVATEGPKSFGGITARLFNARAKVQTNLVSYTAAGAALQDLIGGQVEAFFCDIASAAQLIKQGRLRMLAVTSAARVPGWDTPAISESIPGFDMVGWFALVAPAGIPKDVLVRVNATLVSALQDRNVSDKIHAIGPDIPGAGTPEDLAKFLLAEHRKWTDISKEVGLLPE